ncbi:MAG: carboxypeptidase-like regulatory domain-containing protein [Candidatus Azobacteroides sp.]|nr:carboxypeptidase-like regulatory domain-containing protein [Candidatus Azobacteroides sp.]
MFLIIALLFSFSQFSVSQNQTWNISGNITDGKTSNTLPFANVVLYRSSDVAFVSGTVTNDNGYFSLNAVKNEYL